MNIAVRAVRIVCTAAAIACWLASGTAQDTQARTVTVRITSTAANSKNAKTHMPPSVVWLQPTGGRDLPPRTRGPYTLLQKNRTFTPHILVVPVGSVVRFPNEDPFFHNVFSLFNGKRFDLGLYEAGKTKEVTFSREGLSYIFCNIHPQMSAVVIALSTPLYAEGEVPGAMEMRDVPAGDYELHVWIEGQSQAAMDRLTRRVHVGGAERNDSIEIVVSAASESHPTHTNKFGQPYDHEANPIY
jgi:hypothetical protein